MTSTSRLSLFLCLLLLAMTLPLGAEVMVEFNASSEPARVAMEAMPKQLADNPALLLPYFSVEPGNLLGATTLFAVRNNSDASLNVRFTYYDGASGQAAVTETRALEAHAVRTVNLREVQGLPVDADGFSSGYMVAEALGLEIPEGIISGDYFRVDPSIASASGGELLDSKEAECQRWTHRFFSGGSIVGTSKISFTVRNAPADGPVIVGNLYNEAGALLGTAEITSNESAFELTDLDLQLPVEFGSVDWVFQGESYGAVNTTLTSEPLFSVGMKASCTEGIDEPEPDGTVTFELPGTYLTCRRCGNWQYNMPFPERMSFSKVVIDFEVFVNGFDPNRTSGFHCIFWLNNGDRWQDMMGYLNTRGTRGQTVFQSNGPLGNPIGVEKYASPTVVPGQSYRVHYEYDTVEKVVWYEIRTMSGEVRVADFIPLPSNVGPVSTNYTFIQFGSQPGGAVESLTEGWSWSNFRAQFIP